MHIGICAGGPRKEIPKVMPADYWIAADSGALHLFEVGIEPDCIIGDMDSISDLAKVEWATRLSRAIVLPAEKDETDTQLALEKAVQQEPERVTLYGVTGGRLDHYQAVLHDVAAYQQRYPTIQFEITNATNRLRFLLPGTTILQQDSYTYCSFFSWHQQVKGLTLEGFKYPVIADTIAMQSSRFTSNEILKETGSITFSSGICLTIQSREESGD